MKKVLDIQGLTKRYKNGRGVGDISFSIGEGEILGILGPNGSGKTTVMKSIMGFCRYDSGNIRVFEHDPRENKEAALAHVGSLIESPALYENMTAKRQLKMMARLYPDLPPTAVENALKDVGLEQYANEKVRRFSLGMKQRLGIAMAFLSKPELVILDEPTNGLDIESTVELRNRIVKMAKRDKRSFLVSGHNADEIEKMCDRVVIIYEGQLVDDITVEEALRLSPTLEDYFLMRVRDEKDHFVPKGGASR